MIIFLVVLLPLLVPWSVIINSAQAKVTNMNGNLVFYRGATNYCTGTWDCDGLSDTTSESSFWEQCCTTEMCNNVSIPADVSSLAALEQCYLGQTPAECYGAPVLLSRLRKHWNNDTHSLSVESHYPNTWYFYNTRSEHLVTTVPVYTAPLSCVTAASHIRQPSCAFGTAGTTSNCLKPFQRSLTPLNSRLTA